MNDARRKTLVLGIGNRLLRDDAAGPLVIEALHRLQPEDPVLRDVTLLDGGTLGLSLLPDIEAAGAFIAIDAARFCAAPGTVRVFEGDAMDAQVIGRKQTAHEVALADLMGAAAIQGLLAGRRALVAVQPLSTDLGLDPTAAVQVALPALRDAVLALLQRWQHDEVQPLGQEAPCTPA